MSALLESILNGDYVSANEIFEQKMAEIQEQKLVEAKKQIQAEMFGMSRAEIEAKKKAGYRKAADVLGDPRDIKIKPLVKTKKIKKKKVTEAVEVQPDPEGRVRGGRSTKTNKTKENPLVRKLAAQAIKYGRKIGGAEFRKSYIATKKSMKAGQEQPKDSPFPSDMHQTQTTQTTGKKEPGFVKRNINTLMGHEPDYDRSQRDPIKQGGRVGKYVRGAVGRLASDASQTWE